jgi:murein DD-endopeptidase MepM/ murein hydrolase activator NlpD
VAATVGLMVGGAVFALLTAVPVLPAGAAPGAGGGGGGAAGATGGGGDGPGPSRPSGGGDAVAVADVSPDRRSSFLDQILARADVVRDLSFPVLLGADFTDTFGACRGRRCERSHKGNDLFAPKLRPLVAARSGTVTWLRDDASGTAGNGVAVTDADGWRYLYLHLNDDTPGTDDGANPTTWRFGPGIELGAEVEQGQLIGYLGDSGNAETTPPHVHFEVRTPQGVEVDPFPSLAAAVAAPEPGFAAGPAITDPAPAPTPR